MFEIEIIDDEYIEWSFDLLSNGGFTDFDPKGDDIYKAAIQAIIYARVDGQSSGKHSPESWQEETITEQAEHANDHAYNFLSMIQEPEHFPFDIKEAEHALCRLAIAIALFKRQENKNAS